MHTKANQKVMNITILGAGAWGTALAIALAKRHQVILWGRDPMVITDVSGQRQNNTYLPGVALPEPLVVSTDFDAAVQHVGQSGLLIVASTLAGLRPLLLRLKPHNVPNVVWLCKGFEEGTGLLPHQVARDVVGDFVPVGALSGPSFAQEVACGLPCGLTIATISHDLRDIVVQAVHGGNLRVYTSEDIVGVEVAGAVKNILAIATGISDGLGLGLNARAALMTRGLAEMIRLGVALGGHAETFMGLAGVGDIILTCTGDLSRNRQVGLCIASGKSLDAVVAELGQVAEGVRCLKVVQKLAHERGVLMPITDAVAAVLFDGENARTAVENLLSRDAQKEKK